MTRREYIHVGSTAASLRPTVMKSLPEPKGVSQEDPSPKAFWNSEPRFSDPSEGRPAASLRHGAGDEIVLGGGDDFHFEQVTGAGFGRLVEDHGAVDFRCLAG